MTHPRRIVRDAVAARLAEPIPDSDPSYRTACEGRVYTSRIRPLFARDMPAALVYTGAEKIDRASGDAASHGPLIRELELAIEVVAAGNDEGLDAALDDIAIQVERALDGFEVPHRPLPDWEWTVTAIRLSELETDYAVEGERVTGGVRLTYAVTYRTARRIAEDGQPPSRVFAGVHPAIGAAHEDNYTELPTRELPTRELPTRELPTRNP